MNNARIAWCALILVACSGPTFSSKSALKAEEAGSSAGAPDETGSTGGSAAGADPMGDSGSPGSGGILGVRDRVCTPGATQDCVGPGRCDGAQVCADDGKSWGACACSDGTGGSSAGEASSGGSKGSAGASSIAGMPSGGGGGAGSGGSGGMLSNSGGAAGFAGMTPAGGSGGAAYCSEITPPIAYDCSGDCAEQGALCDAVSCTNNPLRNYTLSATSLNIDEYVLPPHAIAPAPGCSSCQAITTATNMTVVTVYSLALRMRNDTASSVWFKVTSPDFGVFFDTQEPDQGICGSNSSYTQCGGDELAAGVTTIIRLYARSLPTPQTHWIHIEAHPMKWSGWDYCSPSPL